MLMETIDTQGCRDFAVPVPAELSHIAASTRATVTGNPDAPLIVLLGGISADRFVCGRPDGGRGWWPDLVGPGATIDPAHYRVMGFDFAADETGRVAPSTLDQAVVVCAALDVLGAAKADAIIGASYGAMVGLSLAQHFPDRVGRLVAISAPAEPHASATAIRELQRRIVGLGLASGNGHEGLAIARGLAMLSYRTPEEFAQRFTGGLLDEDPLGRSEPGAYLRSRGAVYHQVMSPERFLSMSGSIDRHRIDPASIPHPVLVIGALSDRLVPPEQLRSLAAALPNAELHLLDTLYGHDMFLKEPAAISALITPFLDAA